MTQKIKTPYPSKFHLKKLSDINRAAIGFKSKIGIRMGGVAADAKSFIELIALLDAKEGYLEITVEGEDAPRAVRALREALEGKE